MQPMRYHTLNDHYCNSFRQPIQKAVIDAGFTCPNLDGTVSVGGCIFCNGGSGHFTNVINLKQPLNGKQNVWKYQNGEEKSDSDGREKDV